MAINLQTVIHKNFVIVPQPLEFRDAPTNPGNRWTVGGFIHPKDHPGREESFLAKGAYASTHDEAVTLAVTYAKRIIDSR
jgi:hypothetical protein